MVPKLNEDSENTKKVGKHAVPHSVVLFQEAVGGCLRPELCLPVQLLVDHRQLRAPLHHLDLQPHPKLLPPPIYFQFEHQGTLQLFGEIQKFKPDFDNLKKKPSLDFERDFKIFIFIFNFFKNWVLIRND